MVNRTYDVSRGALIIALGLFVPYLFHLTSLSGQIFLPMHLPILIGAAYIKPRAALFVGLITPILSSLLTGMPPFIPFASLMSFELGMYGLCFSWLMQKNTHIYLSLICSMVCGRITLGIIAGLFVYFFGFNLDPVIYIKTAIWTGLPGILLQIAIVPGVIRALNAAFFRASKA